MKKAIVTAGVNRHAELLELSRPLFEAYATRHGYEYIEISIVPPDRPASWLRIPALLAVLQHYDAALWFGCDVVIVDGHKDIADLVPADSWQAMVAHHVSEGEVPNDDVWYLTPYLVPYLHQAWELRQYIHHPWWSQAALIDLMGYDLSRHPIRHSRPSELYDHTHFLPLPWNSHESSARVDNPIFAHATYGSIEWRLEVMKKYIAQVTA